MILVTGGAGFIGSNFILDWLAQSDEQIINLDKLTYAGNLQNLDGVRLQAAKDLDGRKNRNLAMTLAVAADAESKPDVQREMFLALGRIASNDAILALRKAAEPGGRLFRRKPQGVRLAAVAGLHVAGPSGSNALKELLEDEDREVRAAAEKALQTLWE